MLRVIVSTLISAVASTALSAAASVPASFQQPVVFEPNRGQAPQNVAWIARAPGYVLFISGDGATMMVPESSTDIQGGIPRQAQFAIPQRANRIQHTEVSVVRMKLTGSHAWNGAVGLEPTGGVSNYFLGTDPKAWKRDIPQYSRLSVPGVYDGVDLVFYSRRNQLEYDFVVAPGADPKKIQLAFEGTERLRVDQAGDLVLTASGGSEIHHVRPHVYQQEGGRNIEVAGRYNLLDDARASFTLASYDRHKDLIIDPTVSFTRFLSGSSADIGNAIAADTTDGNSYVTGVTLSLNFPVVNPYHPNQGGALDAFLTKLDPNGNIIFSTYFGGVGTDVANGIAVDSTGIYITGSTLSADFPGHRNLPANSEPDMFVTKFPLTGGIWIYSFETGGTNADSGQAIAVDSAHQAYVTGYTYSADFPKVGTALTNFYGQATAFFMKVSASGTILDSTYLGGSHGDLGYGIAVDGLSSPWITGMTCSNDFPQTLPVTASPGCNTFVTRLSSTLNAYEFSGVFGGGNSRGSAIAVESYYGYVTGTTSASFPTTPGAFQTSLPNTQGSAFVMKIGFLGDIYYSTYLGAKDGYTNGTSIVPGRNDEVYVSGATSSSAFPGAPVLTPNPTAGFVTRMYPELNGVNYTTLLGASINGIALYYPAPSILIQPQIYTTGWRYTGAHDYYHEDAFVVKLTQ